MRTKLTPAQEACLKLAAQGFQDKEIAAELNLSPRTVGNHLSAAYRRLEVSGRREAIRLMRADPTLGSDYSGQPIPMGSVAPDRQTQGVTDGPSTAGDSLPPSGDALLDLYAGLGRWRTPAGWRGPKIGLILLSALLLAVILVVVGAGLYLFEEAYR